MNNESERPNVRRISWILWGVLIVLVVMLFAAFSRAWTLRQRLEEKEAQLIPLVTEQAYRHATLEAELTYVASDEYTHAWAREKAGQTQAGETLVRPFTAVPSVTPTPTVIPSPTPTPTPASFWQQLWETVTGQGD
jgi:hypothetical protein